MYFTETTHNFTKKETHNIMRGMQEKGSKIMSTGDIKGHSSREWSDHTRGTLIPMGGPDHS